MSVHDIKEFRIIDQCIVKEYLLFLAMIVPARCVAQDGPDLLSKSKLVVLVLPGKRPMERIYHHLSNQEYDLVSQSHNASDIRG